MFFLKKKLCGQRNVSDRIQPVGCRFVVSELPGTHGHFVLSAPHAQSPLGSPWRLLQSKSLSQGPLWGKPN